MPFRNTGRLNCYRLWRVWTLIFLTVLYAYLIYDSVYNYVSFKENSMDLAFGSNYSAVTLNLYLASIIAGLTFFPLGIYCLLFFNGNYGDDGIKLGRDSDDGKIMEENNPNSDRKFNERVKILWKRMKRHFLPFSCLLHIASALCFLIPLPFVEAHQIRQRVLQPNIIWHTDLDFLYNPDVWHGSFSYNEQWRITWMLRPQFFNFILSLFSLCLRYAGVFWVCHKGFSFVFSLLMVLACLHIIFDYCSTSVLIRIASNPELVSDKIQITKLSPHFIMFLSVNGSFILLLSFWSVFEFGFQQFAENLLKCRQNILLQCDSSHDGSNISEMACCKRKHLYLRGYLPHLFGIFCCLIGLSLKIPLFSIGINVIYKWTGDPLVLTNVILTAAFLSVWLIAWFGFSLKPAWRFSSTSCSKGLSDISSVTANNNSTLINQHTCSSRDHLLSDQANQIYSCFHGTSSSIHDNSYIHNSNKRDFYTDDSDVITSANYVYLQSAMNPALNQLIVSNTLPHSQSVESTFGRTFAEVPEIRNVVSETDSSYDSAYNIQNQILSNMEGHMRQPQTFRGSAGVLKYSGGSLRSHVPEYIPLQADAVYTLEPPAEIVSSEENNIILTNDHQQPKIYSISQQPKLQLNNPTVSLNRQNSNKKRTFGQRVTFKDEHLSEPVDCSLNNSEQSSNNTSSSDSGIDNNPKHRNPTFIHSQNENVSFNSAVRSPSNNLLFPTISEGKFIPSSSVSIENSFYGYYNPAVTSNAPTPAVPIDDSVRINSDTQSLSFVSESDQEPRLCSQV